jgi:hypothetical protein
LNTYGLHRCKNQKESIVRETITKSPILSARVPKIHFPFLKKGNAGDISTLASVQIPPDRLAIRIFMVQTDGVKLARSTFAHFLLVSC